MLFRKSGLIWRTFWHGCWQGEAGGLGRGCLIVHSRIFPADLTVCVWSVSVCGDGPTRLQTPDLLKTAIPSQCLDTTQLTPLADHGFGGEGRGIAPPPALAS